MKIAHVVSTLPPVIGGMGQVAFDECRALVARGHDVEVFTARRKIPLDTIHPYSFRVSFLRTFLPTLGGGLAPALAGRLRGFDVVHLHYPWYGGAEWVWLSHRRHAVPYVVTCHMAARPGEWYKRLVQMLYDPVFAPRILRRAARVLAVDRDYFEHTPAAWVATGNTEELPNAVDTEIFCPAESEKGEASPTSRPTMLFVGNLLPVKRVDFLLQVFRQLPDVLLRVVGEGPEEARLKRLAGEWGLSSQVQFLGACRAREKLATFYREAAAVLVPSASESFSLVVAEALASGTPVIASQVPGLTRRFASSEGWFCDPESPRSWIGAIEAVIHLTPDQRKKMQTAGRAKAMADYSLDWHVSRLESIYRLVLTA